MWTVTWTPVSYTHLDVYKRQEYAEPNDNVYEFSEPNDTYYQNGKQAVLDLIGAKKLWDFDIDCSDVTVGVMDSGIQTNHEDLIDNICCLLYTSSAKQESIDAILEMAQYKNGRCRLLIATGCLAERYSSDILIELPEVDAIVGTGDVYKRQY